SNDFDRPAWWLRWLRPADGRDSTVVRESDGPQRRPHDAATAPRKKKGRSACSCAAPAPSIGAGWGAGFAASSPFFTPGEGISGGQAPDGGTAPNAPTLKQPIARETPIKPWLTP
ncbi:MAG TPA: hypothetical protein VLB72_17330, partial [Burkholderiales bacterium]|nr:hypothetical protein [Burkholderiales bacterium]